MVSVDPPEANAALIDKLGCPFPVLSDPDRSRLVAPLGLADDEDPRRIAIPATIVVAPDGTETSRHVSRDWADRPTEDETLAALRALDLPAATATHVPLGELTPSEKAFPLDHLPWYLRGARYAVLAMSKRAPELRDETDRYITQVDRYTDAARTRRKQATTP